MAKKTRRKGSNPQRTKFKKAAAACRAQVRSSGAPAFSRQMWDQFGKCMKKSL